MIVEGEEESTTEHLPELIGNHRDLLAADVVVIADAGIWRRGEPALTTTLRGVVDCTVEIRTLDRAAHSGGYGGVAPDALTVLIRTLAALHDERGNVAVEGLATMAPPAIDYDEKDFREEAETRPGLELIGEGTIGERLWAKPAITVIGIDAPTVAGAFNQLVPTARAKISMRIAPEQDPEKALDALTAHVEASVPWGAEARVTRGDAGQGFSADSEGAVYEAARRSMADAWGREPVDMGSGGSVPLVSVLKRTFPDITVLLTGPGDELSGAHSSEREPGPPGAGAVLSLGGALPALPRGRRLSQGRRLGRAHLRQQELPQLRRLVVGERDRGHDGVVDPDGEAHVVARDEHRSLRRPRLELLEVAADAERSPRRVIRQHGNAQEPARLLRAVAADQLSRQSGAAGEAEAMLVGLADATRRTEHRASSFSSRVGTRSARHRR